ncbi:MAG: fibronectin type III domain-containing protein, partial [Candidatus Nanopelagicales bacterium]
MRRNAKGSRNLLVIASAALALSVPSMMVPSWAQELESDALLDSNETWISCTMENSPCPESPTITSVTGEVDSVTVSWSWGDDLVIPENITQIVVRVEPVNVNSQGIERDIPRSNTSARIEGLNSGSDYTISVLGAAGVRLGAPSVVEEATLDEPSTGFPVVDAAMAKPQVTEGDVERIIVTLNDEASAESQAKDISADLPVAGVKVEDTQSLGAGNALINLTDAVSDADAAIIIDDLSTDPRVKAVEVDG